MTEMRRRLARARRLSAAEWRDLLRATVELALARRALPRLDPRSLVAPRDAPTRGAPSPIVDPTIVAHPVIDQAIVEQAIVNRVAWAIPAAAAVVPWRSDCLVQALSAQRWLASAGVATELHLGVADETGFEAHAWLRCRDRVVTGGDPGRFASLAPVR